MIATTTASLVRRLRGDDRNDPGTSTHRSLQPNAIHIFAKAVGVEGGRHDRELRERHSEAT